MALNHNYALSTKLHQLLTKRQLKVCFAESCTGGSLSAEFTAVNGASRFFDCGLITYSNEAKIKLLNVESGLIDTYGAVSEQCAIAMATGALNTSQADLALSITGIAGPSGGSIEKPVGTVYMAIANSWQQPWCQHLCLNGGRKHIRRQCVQAAFELLIACLTQLPDAGLE